MSESDEPVPAESGEADARREPKTIKRYSNRKLYDTVESRYVTLDEIAVMIKAGLEVKVVDNKSKEDLTSITLAQIIFEEEKKQAQMPLSMLREIIRGGGEAVTGFYQEKVGTKIAERISEVKTKAEALRNDVEQRVRGVTQLLRREGDKGEARVQEAMAAGEQAVAELRARIDDLVKQAVDAVQTSPVAAEYEKLQKRIETLEKKLEQLGK